METKGETVVRCEVAQQIYIKRRTNFNQVGKKIIMKLWNNGGILLIKKLYASFQEEQKGGDMEKSLLFGEEELGNKKRTDTIQTKLIQIFQNKFFKTIRIQEV